MKKSLPNVFCVFIITLSDRASKGEYEDLSGPEIKRLTLDFFFRTKWKCEIEQLLIPDDEILLEKALLENKNMKHIIFTTGGTGIGPKDFTPDVIKPMLEKEIPGIMEYIRLKYGQKFPGALLSRSIAGVMGDSLIFALPGSVKAVKEYLSEIFSVLEHTIYMQYGIDKHAK